MSVVRRRYYFWLFKAYIKRWYKAIFTSIIVGVIIFFAFVFFLNFYFLPLVQKKIQKIGYVGTYRTDSIPNSIMKDVSYGLTTVGTNAQVKKGAAHKWEVQNQGKEYIFHLKPGQRLHNGQELTSQSLPMSFKDVQKKNIDRYTVKFVLQSPYSPFLTAISKPILTNKLDGLGEFEVSKVEVNGGFVRSLTLQERKDKAKKKIIIFYPTEQALRSAYSLGDIDRAEGVILPEIRNSKFNSWPNTKVTKNVDYGQLVTLFYNNNDQLLSNKKLRQALSYAVPATFIDGERAYSPIPPTSAFFAKGPNYGISDIQISKDLLEDDKDSLKATYEITTTADYEHIAKQVAKSWERIGIKSKIKVVETLPRNFQILIYPIRLPQDPDQYTLWHSAQIDNITHYKSLRIDKLLEDGRSITNHSERLQIYSDFQKYLIDDAPATFLYFPETYTLTRD